jgi:hypothetical protein
MVGDRTARRPAANDFPPSSGSFDPDLRAGLTGVILRSTVNARTVFGER